MLSYYDTSSGVYPVISKLPKIVRVNGEEMLALIKGHITLFPHNFFLFVDFIHGVTIMLIDPSFVFDTDFSTSHQQSRTYGPNKSNICLNKTEISKVSLESTLRCVIHHVSL